MNAFFSLLLFWTDERKKLPRTHKLHPQRGFGGAGQAPGLQQKRRHKTHTDREREEKCFLYLICFFFFELFYFFVCWWWIVSQQQVPLLPLANQLPRVLPVPHLVLVWEEAVVVVVEAPKWTNPILRSRKLRPRSIPTHDARFAVNKKKQRNKKINELS